MCFRLRALLPTAFLWIVPWMDTLPVAAQESRGTIVGRVSDPSGAAVPGAAVEVTNKAQGVKQTLKTNDAGLYQATYLLPGEYQVAVAADGFKRAVRETVTVNVSDRISVDMTLELGGTDQSITVTAESPLLETASGSIGQVIDTKRIAELPIAHGQPFGLIGLSAGVSQNLGSARLDRPFEPTHIIGFAIAGTRQNRSDITIDGIPSTATANANEVIASYVPPADIVQEFRVQTATFDAQFGNSEGGVTNISIKSGTNDFHGTAYYYSMRPQWFANEWFANANRQERADFNYHRPGGSFTGPVWLPKIYNGKNRTFFTYGYEAIRESRPRNNGVLTTLTEANKNGDFSALLALPNGSQYQIYDPATRRETSPGSGVYTADPFPNNIIPANRINPVSKALLAYWPSPLSAGQADGRFNLTEPNLLETAKYWNNTIRVDHILTDTQRLAFRFSAYTRNSDYNNYFHNLATGENFAFVARSASLDYVKVLTPSTVFNIRYGYNRFIRSTANNTASDGFDLASLGFSDAYTSQIPANSLAFPGISMVNTSTNPILNVYQGTNQGGEYRPNDTHSLNATLNQTIGSHSVKYGTEFRSYRENAIFNGNDTVGRFTFNTLYTRGQLSTAPESPNALGQSAAAFLLGLPTTSEIVRPANYSEQSTTWGFYVHDDWRVNNRLTLNIGVRYEVEGALRERYNRSLAGFNPTAAYTLGAVTYHGLPVVADGGLYNTPKNNILPRFGFAYKLNNKTVMRGGYGIYYGFLGQRRGDVVTSGFARTTTLDNGNAGAFPYDLSNVFVNPVLEPRSPSEVPMSLVGTPFRFFNQDPSSPQQQRWQLSIQRELPGSWLTDIAYVANRGTRIEIDRNINALPNQYLSTSPVRDNANNTFLTTQVTNPLAGLLPGASLNTPRVTRSQLLRPFPQFGDLTTTTNQGYTWYHSLQAGIQRRFSQGYTLMANYTYSKFMQATEYLNPADPMPTEVISDVDTPHRLSVSGMYELPFGRGRAFLNSLGPVTSRFVGGWQINAIYTFQSGRPIGFGNYILNGSFADIPADNPTVAQWINTNAGFNRIANQQLVNNVRTFPLRFGNVRGQALNNIDLSVFKNTAITERVNLQFRAEALNAFNHANFAFPDSNPTSQTFGVVNGVQNYARRIQMGLRLVF